MRYATIRNDTVQSISSEISEDDTSQIVVPEELNNISSKDVILQGRIKNGQLFIKTSKKIAHQLKIALVSNFKMQCGLSSYIENLFPEIARYVGDFKLFIEKNDKPTGNIYQLGDRVLSADHVISCWRRGENLQELVSAIKQYNPDIILVNHEWGIFPDPKHWLSFLTQLSSYRIITVMHSVFPHHQDKTIVEAAMPEIVVHLEGAKHCLINDKKINGKVHVIPHGCYAMEKNEPLWNIYKSDHTFIQAGFGLTYKNFADSIYATAILKKKYADVFFTAIFSESPFAQTEHEMYYRQLISLIEELDIRENVAIIRGYQSDNCMDAYFRTNKAAVFPYKSEGVHFVYGASGSARLAMSKNIPVITSSIPHFSDIVSIKANNPQEIADRLNELFSNSNKKEEQLKKQANFITENSWANIAKKYIAMFENT